MFAFLLRLDIKSITIHCQRHSSKPMLFTEERASCWFGSTWGRVNDDRTFIRGWTIPLKVWTTAFPKLQGWASCQSKWRQSGSSRADRGTAPVRAPRPPLTGRTRKCHHDQPYMGWILNHNCKMKTWTYGTSFWAQHHRLPSRSERSALHNTTLRRGQAAYSCQAARRRLEGGTHLFSADNNKQQNEAEKDGGGGGLLPFVPHGHADEFIVYTWIWAPRRARPSPPPPPPREPAAAARRGHPCPASRRRAAYRWDGDRRATPGAPVANTRATGRGSAVPAETGALGRHRTAGAQATHGPGATRRGGNIQRDREKQ